MSFLAIFYIGCSKFCFSIGLIGLYAEFLAKIEAIANYDIRKSSRFEIK